MMLAREARRMGFRTTVWDPDSHGPALREADVPITAPYEDRDAFELFANSSSVATYEFEHLPAELVAALEARLEVAPGSRLLAICQDRWKEKAVLESAGFPVAPSAPARGAKECSFAINTVGLPVVVKTARAGYDGKGQAVLRTPAEVVRYLSAMTGTDMPLIIERLIPLAAECSVVAVRSRSGTIRTFPAASNIHRNNILHRTRLPAGLDPRIIKQADRIAREVAADLALVGLLCVEMFVTETNELLVNELAPRPHNSGHCSLEGCDISQFEALVRVLAGLPVPEPRLVVPCAMVNLVGLDLDPILREALCAIPGARIHWYGKNRVAPGRKMGHVAIVGVKGEDLSGKVQQIEELIEAAAERYSRPG